MSRKALDLIGMQFGYLVVIKEVERPKDKKSRGAYYLCKCIRDENEIILRKDVLLGNKKESCGCTEKESKENEKNKKINEIIGKRFGWLVVLERGKDAKDGDLTCLCRCEYEGNITTIEYYNLITGHTQSCGCFKTYQFLKEYGEAAFNRVYRQYKGHADEKHLPFELTKEEFKEISQKNCYYCDAESNHIEKSESENGDFVYTGIDRLNNFEGYTLSNCVPCCKKCNTSKLTMSEQDFYAWICEAYNFSAKDRYNKNIFQNIYKFDYQFINLN